ncbi:hypothetical protein ACTWPB_03895 [Nocardia sp. IBHARD005]|uniref:hypothetical protein n=1 Tax=Nocardia sp. IBHARD005 TaxID=3457765 RepID=UPI0040590F15
MTDSSTDERKAALDAELIAAGQSRIADKFTRQWARRAAVDPTQLAANPSAEISPRRRSDRRLTIARREEVPRLFKGWLLAAVFFSLWALPVAIDLFGVAHPLLVAVLLGASLWGIRHIMTPRVLRPFSSTERKQLRSGAFSWPTTPAHLHKRFINHLALREQWTAAAARNTCVGPAAYGGTATYAWREAQLVGLAEVVAAQIRADHTWHSTVGDVHRARIDLNGTLDDINARAYRIWLVHANTIRPLTVSPAGRAVTAHQADLRRTADAAWDALTDRVLILAGYRDQLAAIGQTITAISLIQSDLDLLSTVRARSTDELARQLHIDAAMSELENSDLAGRNLELGNLRAVLETQLTDLRAQLLDANFPLPLDTGVA